MLKSNWYQLFLYTLLILISCNKQPTDQVEKILVITGGHDFESSFFEIFDSFEDVQYDTISQPDFNKSLINGIAGQYDALVFYDMWQDISDSEKDAFIKLLDKGQGLVFLHHSLVSYQHWEEFEKIIGGKYIEKNLYNDPDMQGSTFAEDITLEIKIVDTDHPVTKNVADFSIYDEGYNSVKIHSDIHPLLSASHPDCAPTVGWTNSYGNSKIVYLLPGHGRKAHEDENYRKLVRNAINWVANKK